MKSIALVLAIALTSMGVVACTNSAPASSTQSVTESKAVLLSCRTYLDALMALAVLKHNGQLTQDERARVDATIPVAEAICLSDKPYAQGDEVLVRSIDAVTRALLQKYLSVTPEELRQGVEQMKGNTPL